MSSEEVPTCQSGSQLFLDFVITNYGGNSTDHLRQLIYVNCVASMTNATCLDNPIPLIMHLILQQCARHEPFLPIHTPVDPLNTSAEEFSPRQGVSKQHQPAFQRSKVRPLDGAGSFSLEIATELCMHEATNKERIRHSYCSDDPNGPRDLCAL